PASLFAVGYHYAVALDKLNITVLACDYVYTGDQRVDFAIPGTLGLIYDYRTWKECSDQEERVYPLIEAELLSQSMPLSPQLNFVRATLADVRSDLLGVLRGNSTFVLVVETTNAHGMAEQRKLITDLIEAGLQTPVIIRRSYSGLDAESFQLYAATDLGGLLLDGMGDGIMISAGSCGGDKLVNETAFNILQATRTRISKTEYISCPSCGRTLFDLQETTAKIRARTFHLKGIKIGIMGCIVNGPGEMADADYGYVGSGPGRITLYKGKEVVKRNVP